MNHRAGEFLADSPPRSDVPPAKRRRTRASTACRLCRTRKTRCDNKRPSCGFCQLHHFTCHYPDSLTSADLMPQEPDSAGPTNAAILDRVNHVLSLLEGIKEDRSLPPIANLPANADKPNGNEFHASSAFADAGFGQLEIPDTAARTSASEATLRWPILSTIISGNFTRAKSLGLEATVLQTKSSKTSTQGGIPQDNILILCRRFLTLIHVKNPILDVPDFIQHARTAAEFGPGWDEGGCLVLLACALASVAVPYDADGPSPVLDGRIIEGEDLVTAEACFNAAQRRLGLLSNSLVAVQCQYLAGLYAKFVIRPMAAWTLLHSACSQLQAFLYAKHLVLQNQEIASDSSRARHLEQRLYWSCVKAESELRIELQLPFSGRFKYPDLFPSLSFPSSSDLQQLGESVLPPGGELPLQATSPWSPAAWQSSPETSTLGSHLDHSLQPEEERSWLHYLAEISLRGIMNRILTDLYQHGESAWKASGNSVLRQQLAYVEELRQWHSALPPQLAFVDPFSHAVRGEGDFFHPSNELSLFLMTRYAGALESIYRPSVFVVLNSPDDTVHSRGLLDMAFRGIEAAATLIRLVASHHRHGGVWGLLRRSFGAALMLIATAVSAHRRPQNFCLPGILENNGLERLVELSLRTIRHWTTDGIAGDLAKMEAIITQALDNALAEINSN